MNAYAVVNPLLEAIYYFKMKANGETQAQVLDLSLIHISEPTRP